MSKQIAGTTGSKPKEIDYDKLEVVADKLVNLLKILNYIENTTIRDLKVTANPGNDNEFSFELGDDIARTALTGLQSQLKQQVKLLKPHLL